MHPFTFPDRPDPLGVVRSTSAVMAGARHVEIDTDAIERLVARWRPQSDGWDADLHWRDTGPDGDERTAMWLLVLDALNFCFWPQGNDPTQRWRVAWHGEVVDGYMALVAALTRAVEAGLPLIDAAWLAEVFDADVASILAPSKGHTDIPLLEDRVTNLRELGHGLRELGDQPATSLIRSANGSAMALVSEIVRRFPSFNDTAIWSHAGTGLPGQEVRFYKRAQILVGDLAGGLAGSPLAAFHDLDALTAFADYKVPQVLRALGVVRYAPALAGRIDRLERIPAGSDEEIEIRAATIIACEMMRVALQRRGLAATAAEIDWFLWSEGQHLPGGTPPYHRTVTIFY